MTPALPAPIAAFLDQLAGATFRQQLSFWEKFRTTHRKRIANGKAQLDPELLRAVDDRISQLRPLAASEE